MIVKLAETLHGAQLAEGDSTSPEEMLVSESEFAEGAWFFWEEPDLFAPDGTAEMPDVDETGFAVEIQHGRRLVAIEIDWDRWATIEPTPEVSGEPNGGLPAVDDYVTAVASLLQAAAYAGMDPLVIAREAVLSQHASRAQALDDARSRRAHRGQ